MVDSAKMGSLNPENSASTQDLDDSGCVQDTSVSENGGYKGMAEMMDLSDDVLLYILQYCEPRDLKALGYSCLRLASLVCDHTLWTRVDARSYPTGQKRLRWMITHCLTEGTTELKLSGFVNRENKCMGIQDDKKEPEGASSASADVEHFLLQTWYPHLPRYAASPRWPNQKEMASKAILLVDPPPPSDNKAGTSNGEAGPSSGNAKPGTSKDDGDRTTCDDPNCAGPQFTFTVKLMKDLRRKCPNLTALALEFCNIDYKTTNLKIFPPHLKWLSLRGSRCYNLPVNTSYLDKIQERLPKLEYLDVSECDWFEPASLMALSKLPRLSVLCMRKCRRLSECVAYASLATRYGFKKLQIVDARGSPLADSEVSAFGWLHCLEELYLSPPDEEKIIEHTHKWIEKRPDFDELDAWEEVEPEYYTSKTPEPLDWMEEEEDQRDEEEAQTGEAFFGSPWWAHERRIIVIQPNANRQLEQRFPLQEPHRALLDELLEPIQDDDQPPVYAAPAPIAIHPIPVRRHIMVDPEPGRPINPEVGANHREAVAPAIRRHQDVEPVDPQPEDPEAEEPGPSKRPHGDDNNDLAKKARLDDGDENDDSDDDDDHDAGGALKVNESNLCERLIRRLKENAEDNSEDIDDGDFPDVQSMFDEDDDNDDDNDDPPDAGMQAVPIVAVDKQPVQNVDAQPVAAADVDMEPMAAQGDNVQPMSNVVIQPVSQPETAAGVVKQSVQEVNAQPVPKAVDVDTQPVPEGIVNVQPVPARSVDIQPVPAVDVEMRPVPGPSVDIQPLPQPVKAARVIQPVSKAKLNAPSVPAPNVEIQPVPQPVPVADVDMQPVPAVDVDIQPVPNVNGQPVQNVKIQLVPAAPINIQPLPNVEIQPVPNVNIQPVPRPAQAAGVIIQPVPPRNVNVQPVSGRIIHIQHIPSVNPQPVCLQNNHICPVLRNRGIVEDLPGNVGNNMNVCPRLRMQAQGDRPNYVHIRRNNQPAMHIEINAQREQTSTNHLGYQLVSDSAILRFGRAENDNINYVHIGRNGVRAESGSRPERSNLRVLSATGYRSITDRSLVHLATAAPNLQNIDFRETNVSPRAVDVFRAMRPNCEVQYSEFDKSKE